MAIFSSRAINGTTIIPEPILEHISQKLTVTLSLLKPKGGNCTVGRPGGISPKNQEYISLVSFNYDLKLLVHLFH